MTQLKPGQELARVLITVKTYPAPSARHGETVCIAGVRIDGDQPSFIRLYPIPFRMLEASSQFKKYQVIGVPVIARGTKDPARSLTSLRSTGSYCTRRSTRSETGRSGVS